MIRIRMIGLIAAVLAAFGTAAFASGTASAADTSVLTSHRSLHHLFKQTGVYHQSETPKFVVDPAWPRSLPNDWILGQIGGLYVDQHNHVWVYNRPRTLTNTEAGALEAIEGAVNENGQPINGLGFARPYGPATSCCKPAPSVLEFDANGKLLRAWGGPADPGFIGGKCKEEDGCIWPNTEHGIYVDQNDNVWLAGNGTLPAKPIPWTTNKEGDDGMVLEFDRDGNFKKIIGGPNKNGEHSNAKDGGINGTPQLYRPANMVVDPETNRLYIADGYGNRRIVIVDAETGKYIGHFGAYGNNPIDDAAADTAGTWIDNFHRGKTKPAFFRNPVHCVTIAHDGKLYVCDRGNNRIQVFDTNDPALGTKCGNPNGVAGKCGFIGEKLISARTDTPLGGKVALGTATSIAFSSDAAQSCLYVADISNQVIYILNRDNLEELARLGHKGRMAGEFHWLHQISTDSKGNIYTGEVDTAKRIQKFLRYGKKGCSGTGSDTVGGFGSN